MLPSTDDKECNMWYLMSANSLTEKKRAPIAEVAKHWNNATVYVCTTTNGKVRFCVSCGDLGGDCVIGSKHTWKNDTGMGYRHVPWSESELTIVNIIRFNGKEMVAENKTHLTTSAAIYVFK